MVILSQVVTDGDPVDFVAKVTGTEPLQVKWSKDGKELKPSKIYNISYDKGTCRLHFPEIFPEDAGKYTVEVKNQFGTANATASLQVNGMCRNILWFMLLFFFLNANEQKFPVRKCECRIIIFKCVEETLNLNCQRF